ncbi:NAD(P)-binding Rossmann-fold superfamily protein [Striga asiatica]|uniref:Dihydroflavonol 4-reductase n=1 Tax=Striga asiatica TaxID=4170 RepID=A0A5A7QFJ0_STRAF|nr:NAD(P)-binding Rossmann-fold superfamily protein [Striga asiatica]
MDAIAHIEKMENSNEKISTYCVTGATGYIGSWLVKSLLQKGYKVHATLRNPEKATGLLQWWQGGARLSLFRADLHENGSFDDAVRGCDGVFHVAASMEFDVSPSREDLVTIELIVDHSNGSYIKTNVIDPAIRGTLNVLKACLKSNIRKVVFTSSISTLTAKDSSGEWIQVVDESCQTPIGRVLKTKASGWVYVLSKLLTERAAFQFAEENGIDLISVITTTVGGSFLMPSVPKSIQVLMSPVTGDSKFLSILNSVNSRMGSIALVHIEDICRAHVFLMEHAKAEGRYICCTRSCTLSELVELIINEYPCPDTPRLDSLEQKSIPSEISSKKIRDLGFEFDYSIQDIVQQTIRCCLEVGFLSASQDKS